MNAFSHLPQDFINDVYSHAVAQQRWPELGVRDLAAAELWDWCHQRLPAAAPRAEQMRVERSAWFDERCMEQLAREPESCFLSIGAGLSTRFHRLSQACDWPRFRWWEFDGVERAQCRRQCLPVMDNFTIVGAPESQLAVQVGAVLATSAKPALVLLESPAASLSRATWTQLLHALQAAAAHGPVDLLFDGLSRSGVWRARYLPGVLRELYPQVRFQLSFTDVHQSAPWLRQRQQVRLGRYLFGGWYAVHLQVRP